MGSLNWKGNLGEEEKSRDLKREFREGKNFLTGKSPTEYEKTAPPAPKAEGILVLFYFLFFILDIVIFHFVRCVWSRYVFYSSIFKINIFWLATVYAVFKILK